MVRDGIVLSEDELKAAIESGEVTITDKKGTFGWQFWLPCGKENIMESVDGDNLLKVNVTKDIIKPFDTFLAMLIFNGDKPITVSYHDASATDSITFTPSPIWSYIWRILVILLVIHIILYIIGFFNGKCKSLPRGVFLSVDPGDNPSDEEDFTVRAINETFWERYSWHLFRFIPHKKKLWYHQPSKKIMGYGLEFMIAKNGRPCIVFNHDDMYPIEYHEVSGASEIYEKYRGRLRRYNGTLPQIDTPLKTKEIRAMFKVKPASDHINANKGAPYRAYYGMVEDGKLVAVVVFIQHE